MLELLNEVYDVEALLDGEHGITLRDLVLAAQSLVFTGVDGLDGYLYTRNSVLAKPYRVARALANNVLNGILFKLILEALSIQD